MSATTDKKESELLVHGTFIEDVCIRPLDVHCDKRGTFTEVFSTEWDPGMNLRQWSLVKSMPGTCRGMHVRRQHDECYVLITGHGYLGLHDIRRGSPTERKSMMLELHGGRPRLVRFTRGILHGWYYAAPSTHLQGVTRTYNEYHPEDNLGCDWSDPELDLPWPGDCQLMSERARRFPPLSELLAKVSISYKS